MYVNGVFDPSLNIVGDGGIDGIAIGRRASKSDLRKWVRPCSGWAAVGLE